VILVCGYTPIGKQVVHHLLNSGASVTVVDPQVEDKSSENINFIRGDPLDEENLFRAGLAGAETVVVCTDKDTTNSFIVLLVRSLKHDATILATVNNVGSISKLYKAGADLVISDSIIGGRLLTKQAVSPYVGEFIDRITLSKDAEITEMKVAKQSKLAGLQIRASGLREKCGITVIGIKKGGHILLNPPSHTILEEGDVLVVLGSGDQIKAAAELVKPPKVL